MPTFAGMGGRGRELARALRTALVVLALMELTWLVGVNAVLALHVIPRSIAAHTDSVAMDYRRAWSLFPGDLHVRGYWLRGAEREGVEYFVSVERVSAYIDIAALLQRRFHAVFIDASGAQGRVRKRLSPNQ